MRKIFLFLVCTLLSACATIQEDIVVKFDGIATNAIFQKGLIEKNSPFKKTPAVVLIHTSGGWHDQTTRPLASALNKVGISTLEMRYFKDERGQIPAPALASTVFGALQYLATRTDVDPNAIGIGGFSFGANISLMAASEKFTKQWGGGFKYAAYAPIYPPCWLNSQVMQGKRNIPGMGYVVFDKQAFSKWNNSPIKIFAAELDDYDDRDPEACSDLVAKLPPSVQKNFEIKVYKGATHGWNLPMDLSFYVGYACKGKGCDNRMVRNPKVTSENIIDVTEFFKRTLISQ
jgi:dienelactone hydrolase